jgi:phosphopentomutase
MARAFLFVLDSFGIGGAPDAHAYGDEGADTFGHVLERCASGVADTAGLRSGPLTMPTMARLGLFQAHALANGRAIPVLNAPAPVAGLWGAASETSKGKDTPSGHWEIAGVPVTFDWGYFPHTVPSFPAVITDRLVRDGALPGILGNCHASGTEIIERLGEEHIRTGAPIIYTSADSVIQIAAHEAYFGLERLYSLCEIAFELAKPYRIGRVIARPFSGERKGAFQRTGNRRDFSVDPPEPTPARPAGGRGAAGYRRRQDR